MLKLGKKNLLIDELKTMEKIDLSIEKLEAGGAAVIAQFMTLVNAPLTTLFLNDNGIGAEGAKAIAAALPR